MKKTTEKKVKPLKKKVEKDISFPIVGIGASAGGLEALEQFFQDLDEGKYVPVRRSN